MRVRGFTLIELLIVAAIIAILAAIALPNFLEAQARAKTAREWSDMRSLATALEAYAVDQNAYPSHGEILANSTIHVPAILAGINTMEFTPASLTTPIAYCSSLPNDITLRGIGGVRQFYGYIGTTCMEAILIRNGRWDSAKNLDARYGGWRLYAGGPDGDKGKDMKLSILYDATNGTISNGDLVRSQRHEREFLSLDEP